jgi:hypothetical protein
MRPPKHCRPRITLTVLALISGLLVACDVRHETTDSDDAAGGDATGRAAGVSGRIQEAEAASEMSRQASPSYLGATMRARERATDVLGRADAIREEQVREEREFDTPRRD